MRPAGRGLKTPGVRQRTLICILHDSCYYPYHLQREQGLSLAEFPPRERFCRWFVQLAIAIIEILFSVYFTDVATFGRVGIIYLHNHHLWGTANPHGKVEAFHQ